MDWWLGFLTGALLGGFINAVIWQIAYSRQRRRTAEWEQSAMDLDKELHELQNELRP